MVCYIRTLQLTSWPEEKKNFWLWELVAAAADGDNTAGCVAAGGAVFQRRGPTAPFPPFTHLLSVWFIGKTWNSSAQFAARTYVKWTFAHGGDRGGLRRVEEGIPQTLCQLTQWIIGSWSTWCMSFLLVKFITIYLKSHFNFHVKWSKKKLSVKAAAAERSSSSPSVLFAEHWERKGLLTKQLKKKKNWTRRGLWSSANLRGRFPSTRRQHTFCYGLVRLTELWREKNPRGDIVQSWSHSDRWAVHWSGG